MNPTVHNELTERNLGLVEKDFHTIVSVFSLSISLWTRWINRLLSSLLNTPELRSPKVLLQILTVIMPNAHKKSVSSYRDSIFSVCLLKWQTVCHNDAARNTVVAEVQCFKAKKAEQTHDGNSCKRFSKAGLWDMVLFLVFAKFFIKVVSQTTSQFGTCIPWNT